MQNGAVLSVRGVTKKFGGLVAVDAMDFDVGQHQVMGLIGPNGSGKTTMEKVLVQNGIFDAFLERFVERAAKLKVGDPTADKANVIGPLINDKQAARVRDHIDDAVAKGAQVV